MKIKPFMTRNPICVSPDKSVSEARELMDREKISCLPVLDRNGVLVGITTMADIRKASPTDATTLDRYEINYLLAKVRVEKVMEKHVITVDEDEVVEEAARIMADRNISCLPVMQAGGGTPLLVGIVTRSDLFRVLIDAFGTRVPGVRLSLQVKDIPGQLARLTEAITAKGGNIISLLVGSGDDSTHRREVIRIANIPLEDVKEAVKSLGEGNDIEDIRE
jgi:acetoin utilization protein AcuB